MAFGAEKA
jgi:hypothetical protein